MVFSQVFDDFRRQESSPRKVFTPPKLLWLLFTLSVIVASASRYLDNVAAPYVYLLALAGGGSCAWLWGLSRALFRPGQQTAEPWVYCLIATVVAAEAGWGLASRSAVSTELHRVSANAASFVCIAAIVLVFVELLSGYGAIKSTVERRFRQVCVGVFGAVVAISLLWALNRNSGDVGSGWSGSLLLICALVVVVGAWLAVLFRESHPLINNKRQKAQASSDDRILAQRIVDGLESERLYLTADLKLADLAVALGEPDYKVTQCITAVLGYRNFNQLINRYRIDYAKSALGQADNADRPILAIAYESGFNSIGPFNRAFKIQVGMTPREYRVASLA